MDGSKRGFPLLHNLSYHPPFAVFEIQSSKGKEGLKKKERYPAIGFFSSFKKSSWYLTCTIFMSPQIVLDIDATPRLTCTSFFCLVPHECHSVTFSDFSKKVFVGHKCHGKLYLLEDWATEVHGRCVRCSGSLQDLTYITKGLTLSAHDKEVTSQSEYTVHRLCNIFFLSFTIFKESCCKSFMRVNDLSELCA